MITSTLVFNEKNAMFSVTEAGKDVIGRVTEFFLAAVKTALMVPNPRETRTMYDERKKRKYKIKGNFTPSRPGEPPHLVTGHLRSGVRSEYADDGLSSRVGFDASIPYALWQEFGLPGGKTIEPVKKKALMFNDGTTVFFRRKVKQGALKPRPFFFSTLRNVLPQLRILAGG